MGHTEYKVELKKLRKQLWGHYPEVATEAGVSVTTVSQVLNAVYVNKEVVKAAIVVAERLNTELQQLGADIKKVIQ